MPPHGLGQFLGLEHSHADVGDNVGLAVDHHRHQTMAGQGGDGVQGLAQVLVLAAGAVVVMDEGRDQRVVVAGGDGGQRLFQVRGSMAGGVGDEGGGDKGVFDPSSHDCPKGLLNVQGPGCLALPFSIPGLD